MPRNRTFRRNLAIVGLLHVVLLMGIARWSASARKPLGSDVVWMESGLTPQDSPAEEHFSTSSPAPVEEEPPAAEEPDVQPALQATNNELPLASPSPVPKATPKPSAKPTATPKKSKPSPTPKAAKVASKEKSPSSVKVAGKSEQSSKKSTDSGSSSGSGGRASGAGNSSQFGWYGNMLHDRFFSSWDQPTSVVASGAKMSVLVRLRIEKDGRVSDFALVRPSGNVVVDESVAAVAKRVTQVDPLPAGLGNGGHYEVNINFELNAD